LANPEHLARLKEGVEAWKQWRKQNPKVLPDLSGAALSEAGLYRADLSGADLSEADLYRADLNEANLYEANLSGANLSGADLSKAYLLRANLSGADLSEADLSEANLGQADLREADLSEAGLFRASLSQANLSRADLSYADLPAANLYGANLSEAELNKANLGEADLEKTDFSKANLSKANLVGATLVKTNLEGANLTACRVYGISVWDVRLEGAVQSNLVITPEGESPIQVDNLEVAQFIYLLLNNEKIRAVIDTITSKVVLILGRFTEDRKVVLDALREELRKRGYSPVLFDFEKPRSQTTVETVATLSRMARFVIADLTDAKSVLQELQAVVPFSPSVVVQPLLLASQVEPGMFDFIRKFPWVLDTHRYMDQKTLLADLEKSVIAPAEAKTKELARKSQM